MHLACSTAVHLHSSKRRGGVDCAFDKREDGVCRVSPPLKGGGVFPRMPNRHAGTADFLTCWHFFNSGVGICWIEGVYALLRVERSVTKEKRYSPRS